MKKQILINSLIGSLVLGLTFILAGSEALAQEATVIARWIGGSGNWSDPAHWDIGIVPNNTSETEYTVIIDLPGNNPTITIDQSVTLSVLSSAEAIVVSNGSISVVGQTDNKGSIDVAGGSALILAGDVSNAGSIAAAGGTLQISGATVTNTSGVITASTGIVALVDSTINGGVLRVTDDAASLIRFSGDVTLTGVPWEDLGAGEFQINSTSARLLGDYADHLPAGYTLVVFSEFTDARLTLGSESFVNNGTLELRSNYRCGIFTCTHFPAELYLDQSLALSGSGQILMSTLPGGMSETMISGATGVSLSVGAGQWIHGEGEIRVPVVNYGRIEADVSGRSLTFVAGFENHGILRVLNGGGMSFPGGLTDGGSFELSGSVVLSGVVGPRDWSVSAGGVLHLENAIVDNRGRSIVAHGGRVEIVNSTINDGGTISPTGGVITADGGVVEIANSTINGAMLRVTDNAASLIRFSGDVTLTGVPWEDLGAGEFQINSTSARLLGDYADHLPAGYTLVVFSEFTDARLTLGSESFVNNGTLELRSNYRCGIFTCTYFPAELYLDQSLALSGSGQILMSTLPGGMSTAMISGATGVSLSVGAGQWIHGEGEIRVPVVNYGRIEADVSGRSLTLSGAIDNQGTIGTANSGILGLSDELSVNGLGMIAGQSSGVIAIKNSLLGNTRNADQFAPRSLIQFDGAGTITTPQQLEVMGRDLGPDSTGMANNFAYNSLALANNTYVKLVDFSDNATGTDPEALYVNSLNLPLGTTLDLNGLHLYTRLMQVGGEVIGGTVVQIPDSGSIEYATPTPGSIGAAGELDEWTFFGTGGRSVTVAVNPGGGGANPPPSPYVGYVEVSLLDASDNILASTSSTIGGMVMTLADISLPTDGTYRILIHTPSAQSGSTGNYTVTLWDVTTDFAGLTLNGQFMGTLETPYSVDRWTFSALAGRQVRFDLLNASGSGIAFDLIGPGGAIVFSGISGDSDLFTLPVSGTYILKAYGTGGLEGGNYTFRMLETTLTDLALGVTYNGEIAGTGQAQLFRLTVPASMPLRVVLDDADNGHGNEIYLKFGLPPTRSDYDYRFEMAASADQEILVPLATAGTWYILLYNSYAASSSIYSLQATASGLLLSGVTPDRQTNSADAVLTITGAGFDASTMVELVASGATYPAYSVNTDFFTQITAVFVAIPFPPAPSRCACDARAATSRTAASLSVISEAEWRRYWRQAWSFQVRLAITP